MSLFEASLAVVFMACASSFFGFVNAGRRALRMERKLREQLNGPLPPWQQELEGFAWAERHPVKAVLLEMWMLSALVGPCYIAIVFAVAFVSRCRH